MIRVLGYVRNLLRQAHKARPSAYRKGYITALEDVIEYILDEEWARGVDDEN